MLEIRYCKVKKLNEINAWWRKKKLYKGEETISKDKTRKVTKRKENATEYFILRWKGALKHFTLTSNEWKNPYRLSTYI
jgi:hypothetical protein